MEDAARAQPRAGLGGLIGGLGAQAMIHGEPDGAAAAPFGPTLNEKHQAQTVRAAGHGDGNFGRRLERAERRDQAGEGIVVEGMVGMVSAHSGALGLLSFAPHAIANHRRRVRVVRLKLREGRAGFGGLAHAIERHAQF